VVVKHSSRWFSHATRFFPYGSGIQTHRAQIVRLQTTDTLHHIGTGMLPVKRQSWIYSSCFYIQCRADLAAQTSWLDLAI
jgi:hypothetical protein